MINPYMGVAPGGIYIYTHAHLVVCWVWSFDKLLANNSWFNVYAWFGLCCYRNLYRSVWSWERSTQQSRLGSRYWLTKTANLQSWLVVWDCFGQCCSTSGQSQFVHLSCASLHFITLTYGCIAHAQLVFKMCICISKHQSVMTVQVHDSSSLYLSYRVWLVLALEITCSCAYTTHVYVPIFVDVTYVSSLFSRYDIPLWPHQPF